MACQEKLKLLTKTPVVLAALQEGKDTGSTSMTNMIMYVMEWLAWVDGPQALLNISQTVSSNCWETDPGKHWSDGDAASLGSTVAATWLWGPLFYSKESFLLTFLTKTIVIAVQHVALIHVFFTLEYTSFSRTLKNRVSRWRTMVSKYAAVTWFQKQYDVSYFKVAGYTTGFEGQN